MTRSLNPASGLQSAVRLYPWSVLLDPTAGGLAMIVEGSWLAVGIIFSLVFAIALHSVHRETRRSSHDR